MNEIYWIQRLDNFYSCLEALLVFSIVAVCILIPAAVFGKELTDPQDFTAKSKRWLTATICTLSLSAAGLVFMPTTNEALTIMGVGTVIDYVQDNESLQELPDKCVKALEAWADSLNEEDKK